MPGKLIDCKLKYNLSLNLTIIQLNHFYNSETSLNHCNNFKTPPLYAVIGCTLHRMWDLLVENICCDGEPSGKGEITPHEFFSSYI